MFILHCLRIRSPEAFIYFLSMFSHSLHFSRILSRICFRAARDAQKCCQLNLQIPIIRIFSPKPEFLRILGFSEPLPLVGYNVFLELYTIDGAGKISEISVFCGNVCFGPTTLMLQSNFLSLDEQALISIQIIDELVHQSFLI